MHGEAGSSGGRLNDGKKYDLDDLEKIHKTCFQKFQVKVISTQNGYGLIAQIPEKKDLSDERDFLLHDKAHYDPITTLPKFHMKSYYRNAS